MHLYHRPISANYLLSGLLKTNGESETDGRNPIAGVVNGGNTSDRTHPTGRHSNSSADNTTVPVGADNHFRTEDIRILSEQHHLAESTRVLARNKLFKVFQS